MKPILPDHVEIWQAVDGLDGGFHGDHVDFELLPYDQRDHEHQASHDALEADIAANGIRNPLITHRGRVLVGQRRLEIARKLGIDMVKCLEISEEVAHWDREDVYVRLEKLLEQYT